MSGQIRVIQVGLGPIGLKITRCLSEHGAFQIVAAVDVDERKTGSDLGKLAGMSPLGVEVVPEFEALEEGVADVVVLATVSSLKEARKQILAAVDKGFNLVSTCEELSYPHRTQPDLSRQIDRAARARGVSVLGTGINPGFLMDFLPLALTGACLRVDRISVERFQDASQRRLPFQRKIGAGLTVEEFHRQVARKRLRHVGLTESMHMVADRLGWALERTEDVIEPVVAEKDVVAGRSSIQAGLATGVNQVGRAFMKGREVIRLTFRATVGERDSYDRIAIEGIPDLDLRVAGGINGDVGTVAVTVNAIPRVLAAAPGLRTMADIEPLHAFAGPCLEVGAR